MSWTLDRRREARPRDPFRQVGRPFDPEPVKRAYDDRVRRYDVASGTFMLPVPERPRMWELVDEHRELVARYGYCLVEEARTEARKRGLSVLE